MNNERLSRLAKMFASKGADYHAIICQLPQNLVMLTGYQPILGNSFCIVSLNANKEVEFRLAVPEDEKDRVPQGIAVEIRTYAEETMDYISDTAESVRVPLGELLRSLHLHSEAMIGYESPKEPIAMAYTQVGIPGSAILDLLHSLFLGDYLRDAMPLLNELAAIKSDEEIGLIRRSEEVAYQGFKAARDAIRVGATEADVAAATYAALLISGYASPGAEHVTPHVHVMAGKRAALAYRAFNLTSNYTITQGDTVTVQMEIGINGYWAELTRTFFVGTISDDWRRAHQTCVAAQDAALKSIRDGATGRDIDRDARNVMESAGFGSAFKHGLGHGFGFQAINHSASPVLHPASKAVLHTGMVHNMEPAVYLDGIGGLRLNDNVAVLQNGNEVLSKMIPRDLDWLVVG